MKLQTLKDQKGFTIVELLIVIVVIGILAAITIVAFNGIQNRGKATSAQAAADTIAKKAEAANAITGNYPQAITEFAAQKDSELTGSGIVVVAAAPSAAPSKPSTVMITPCSGTDGTGGVVTYWDYTNNTVKTRSYGTPTATGTCAAGTVMAATTF